MNFKIYGSGCAKCKLLAAHTETAAQALGIPFSFTGHAADLFRDRSLLPAKLEHLLRDPRFPGMVRHLRKLYDDPMTGEEWQLVTDPAERIIGVRSSSDLEPFQKEGFPKALAKLTGKDSYSEWEFVYTPSAKTSKATSTTKTTGASGKPSAGAAQSGAE